MQMMNLINFTLFSFGCLAKLLLTPVLAKALVSNLIDFQCFFIQMIVLKYWNPDYQIGLAVPIVIERKRVYHFPEKELMIKEMHQGRLYYRLKGFSRRISYSQLKKGIAEKTNHD